MKVFLVAAFFGIVLALSGCSGQVSGTARGLFIGYVTDKTEEEVVAKVGKPESVDTKPTTLRWTYKKKTFDPDNQSLVDDETILIFQKGTDGKFKVVQVIFG
jgi:hypothetical protein